MKNGWLRVRLKHLGEVLRVGLWFVPTIMVLGAIAGAFTTLTLDRHGFRDPIAGAFYSGGPEGARQMLSTIAASMMTVAGVAFSVTIVALSLASQQFGPRLLRNFMSDRGNQIVLGTFIGTYAYCLLVLRAVHGGEDDSFTPHFAVTVAVALALVGVGVLIYFVHHVSASIQADNVVARTAGELDAHIDRLGRKSERSGETSAVAPPDEPPRFVRARQGGYISGIDEEALVDAARNEDLVIRLRLREGEFCVEGSILADVWGADETSGVAATIAGGVAMSETRVAAPDLELSLAQLSELAVRSLSPGINDPFTAIACINRLATAVARLSVIPLEPGTRRDSEGRVRLFLQPRHFERLVGQAFDQVRLYGARHPAVAGRLLEVLAAVAEAAPPETWPALRRQARLTLEGAVAERLSADDEREVRERYERFSTTTA